MSSCARARFEWKEIARIQTSHAMSTGSSFQPQDWDEQRRLYACHAEPSQLLELVSRVCMAIIEWRSPGATHSALHGDENGSGLAKSLARDSGPVSENGGREVRKSPAAIAEIAARKA